MAGFTDWTKENAAPILISAASGLVAIGVAYGAFKANETETDQRIKYLENGKLEMLSEINKLENQIDKLDDTIEYQLREIRDLIIGEGRDLERKIIRLEQRLDNVSRRLAIIDGIGAPSAPMLIIPAPPTSLVPEFDNIPGVSP